MEQVWLTAALWLVLALAATLRCPGPDLRAIHDSYPDIRGRQFGSFAILPFVTPWFFERFGGRVSDLEAKYLLFLLFALGGLATWAGSEAVLPAYVIDMVLAGSVGKDHVLIRPLRTLTFGLLTPFYFIRAGSLVSASALVSAPLVFLSLLAAKMLSKMIPLVPTVRAFNYIGHEGMYYSLMMSTGLTFGTISALFGLNHQIISQTQYSHLVATVIGSAVIPTAIANAYFMPRHLLPKRAEPPSAEGLAPAGEEAH
jgi:glutathione-regulated potassium-efflux system ancillary protein KefC